MDVDWTADEARQSEAGPETDRRVLREMGATRQEWRGIYGMLKPFQASRTAEGAHRARAWLREEVGPMLMDLDDIDAPLSPEWAEVAIWDDGDECRATAPTEHLATARLTLVLAAEGVLDGADAPGGGQ